MHTEKASSPLSISNVLAIIGILLSAHPALAQVSITPTNEASELSQTLFGEGVNIINVTLTPGVDFSKGPPTGTYEDGPLGMPDGIISCVRQVLQKKSERMAPVLFRFLFSDEGVIFPWLPLFSQKKARTGWVKGRSSSDLHSP